jgi:hypothetical protein
MGNSCPTCGVLGANAAKVQKFKWGHSRAAQAVPSGALALFPQLDPRLATLVPRGLALAFASGLGLGLLEQWLWLSTIMALACFAMVVAGLIVYVCWQRSSRLGAAMLGVATVGAAAMLAAGRVESLAFAWALRGTALIAIIVLSLKGLAPVVDRPVRLMWWVAVGGLLVVLGRAAYAHFLR